MPSIFTNTHRRAERLGDDTMLITEPQWIFKSPESYNTIHEVPAYQPSHTDIKAPTVDERIKAITDTLIELKKERKELRKKKHQNIAKANYYELQLSLIKKEKENG